MHHNYCVIVSRHACLSCARARVCVCVCVCVCVFRGAILRHTMVIPCHTVSYHIFFVLYLYIRLVCILTSDWSEGYLKVRLRNIGCSLCLSADKAFLRYGQSIADMLDDRGRGGFGDVRKGRDAGAAKDDECASATPVDGGGV